jgi:enoyl-CoA hydratase
VTRYAAPHVALEVVRHAVGAAARRLVLDAMLLRPDEAMAVGLIDRITTTEALLEEAIAQAERLARIPADVFAFTKHQLQGPARIRIDAISEADEVMVTAMWASPSTQTAINDFLVSIKK